MHTKRILIAVSGASGAIYARRLLEILATLPRVELHTIISDTGAEIFRQELRSKITPDGFTLKKIGIKNIRAKHYHHCNSDFTAPPASGSFGLDAMAVVPASMGFVGRCAAGVSSSLMERAADCALKERKTLVIVPRETPLSLIHLENLLKLARAGAVILPPAPGFYGKPETIGDIVDFVVGKILDAIGMQPEPRIGVRWTGKAPDS